MGEAVYAAVVEQRTQELSPALMEDLEIWIDGYETAQALKKLEEDLTLWDKAVRI